MGVKVVNKEINAKYEVLEKYEAGVVLTGAEVKSVKLGHINLKGSYVRVKQNQGCTLVGAHIAAYKPARQNQKNYNPTRERKLLLTKTEINRLSAKLNQKGLTIAPLKVYTTNGLIKFEIGLLKGLKKYDKRAKIKKRDLDRDVARSLRGKY